MEFLYLWLELILKKPEVNKLQITQQNCIFVFFFFFLKSSTGWPHNFHKKIPGPFQDFSRKITFFKDNFKGQKTNN